MVLERSVIYLKPLVTLKGRHKLHYDFSLSFNASERLEKKAIASYINRFWQRKTVITSHCFCPGKTETVIIS
jgi:hypothetical protein